MNNDNADSLLQNNSLAPFAIGQWGPKKLGELSQAWGNVNPQDFPWTFSEVEETSWADQAFPIPLLKGKISDNRHRWGRLQSRSGCRTEKKNDLYQWDKINNSQVHTVSAKSASTSGKSNSTAFWHRESSSSQWNLVDGTPQIGQNTGNVDQKLVHRLPCRVHA